MDAISEFKNDGSNTSRIKKIGSSPKIYAYSFRLSVFKDCQDSFKINMICLVPFYLKGYRESSRTEDKNNK